MPPRRPSMIAIGVALDGTERRAVLQQRTDCCVLTIMVSAISTRACCSVPLRYAKHSRAIVTAELDLHEKEFYAAAYYQSKHRRQRNAAIV